MGLTLKGVERHRTYVSLTQSADWPIRLFYGLVTLYQGLYGIFVPSSIFYQATYQYDGAVVMISLLLIVGILMIADGVIAMIRYCTNLRCDRLQPLIALFNRRRPLLFLPPVFCYYITLILVNNQGSEGFSLVISYYVLLSLAGVVFCIRDGIISQKARRGTHG